MNKRYLRELGFIDFAVSVDLHGDANTLALLDFPILGLQSTKAIHDDR
jgi:hypothetical protein